MSWYDQFARFYDASLEKLYAPHRARLVEHLDDSATFVVDFPCGTGQMIPYLQKDGREVLGVDKSEKMLARARELDGEHTLFAGEVNDLVEHLSGRPVDAIVSCLGLSVIPDWERALTQLIELIRPGGQLLVMDVIAKQRTLSTWWVEKIAQADLSRDIEGAVRAHEKIDEVAREKTDAKERQMGGELFLLSARLKG